MDDNTEENSRRDGRSMIGVGTERGHCQVKKESR